MSTTTKDRPDTRTADSGTDKPPVGHMIHSLECDKEHPHALCGQAVGIFIPPGQPFIRCVVCEDIRTTLPACPLCGEPWKATTP